VRHQGEREGLEGVVRGAEQKGRVKVRVENSRHSRSVMAKCLLLVDVASVKKEKKGKSAVISKCQLAN